MVEPLIEGFGLESWLELLSCCVFGSTHSSESASPFNSVGQPCGGLEYPIQGGVEVLLAASCFFSNAKETGICFDCL